MGTTVVPSKTAHTSSHSGDVVVPSTRLRLRDLTFSVAAARTWNVLTSELKATHVTPTFKRTLLTFMYF